MAMKCEDACDLCYTPNGKPVSQHWLAVWPVDEALRWVLSKPEESTIVGLHPLPQPGLLPH